MSQAKYTASCLCSGVQLELATEPGSIDLCHCSMCRKAQGCPFASNAPISSAAVSISSGTELITSFESSPGHERAFCRRCGSPLFSRNAANPGVLRIRVGLINEPLHVRPGAHYFVGSKANWWTIHGRLPRFETE